MNVRAPMLTVVYFLYIGDTHTCTSMEPASSIVVKQFIKTIRAREPVWERMTDYYLC
jgi:hypothetical protein